VTPEEFRAAAHELVDWIADLRLRIPDLPVRSEVTPGEVRTALTGPPPEHPEDFSAVLRDLDRVVVPGITQVQSPGYFAWFPSNSSLASVLGDMASSGIGALGITWASAPALTEVEEVVTEWLRELCGLAPEWRGAIHDTASTACLVAMLVARERATGLGEHRGGLQAEPAPLVVYASPQAHSSVPKAVLLAGFGRENLRLVDVDPTTYAMDPEALRAAMAADVAAGLRPAAVVASVGTTGTTAVDPVAAIVAIAAEHGAWVHVDAAMAGSAMLLPECRHLFAGVDGADSLSWNPHKWLGTVLDTSLLYVRDVDHLTAVMSTNPSYLRSAVDGEVTQYKDWGIPLGRRFRALKLWFHLRLDGAEAIRARLRRDLENARWLAAQVAAEPGWEVLAPVALQTVCVRHVPAGLRGSDGAVTDPDAVDAHTLAWVERVNASGRAFLTAALLDGRWMARVSIGAEATERSDVEELWARLREAALTTG
jgi:aromatic-L-amino-acid decarboxylase